MAVTRVLGDVTHARGYVFNEWGRQVIYLFVMAIALWFLLPHGLEGVALAVSIATFARYLLLTELAVKLAGIGWRQFFLAQVPGGFLGIIVSATVSLTLHLGNILEMSDALQLLIMIPVALLSLMGGVLLFPSSWFGELYPWVNERLGMNLPYWLRKIMAIKLSTTHVSDYEKLPTRDD